MRLFPNFVILGTATLAASKAVSDKIVEDLAVLSLRALPNSPSGGYAPEVVDCPGTKPEIRLASGLSDQESEWLTLRRNKTVEPMKTLLKRAAIPEFDIDGFFSSAEGNASALPNIAIAVSGGGYRALLNGAGFISAADSRSGGDGEIAGLLQSSTYLAGLSGGGWLVGSIFANNFSSIPQLQEGREGTGLWQFDRSIFSGPEQSGIRIFNTVAYWQEIADAVDSKANGWETSITDYWGRALSYQLIGADEGGPAYTFSSIALTSNFEDASTPFPILVADGRKPGERIVSLNATVYEFTPFELGSWDSTTYGFAPLEYIASNFSNGRITDNGKCVRGFDQYGFTMGTSSSLFNQFLLANITAADTSIPDFIVNAVEDVLKELDQNENDIAQYQPNPFLGWNPTGNATNSKDDLLALVDGGEDLQNIPLHPLIQPIRNVDIIFAIDSSADTTTNWPNGTALRATYERSMNDLSNGTLFPPIPSAETFINEKLNQRPTLFGCDARNFTLSDNQTVPPLVFYIPNAPYTTHSNVSTFDPTYSNEQRDAIITNGYNAATQGNGTLDQEWSVCVACAILSRTWYRENANVPESCTKCFDRYCWDGTEDNKAVNDYEPAYIIGDEFNETSGSGDDGDSGSGRHQTSLSMLAYVLAGVVSVVVF